MADDSSKPNDPSTDAIARAAPTGGRCPICQAPAIQKFRPFCSGTCADLDLLRWLRGGYVIAPSNSDEDEDGEAPADVSGSSKPDDSGH